MKNQYIIPQTEAMPLLAAMLCVSDEGGGDSNLHFHPEGADDQW